MEWSKDCTWTTVSAKGAGFLNCPALCLFNCSMCNSLEVYVGNSTGMNAASILKALSFSLRFSHPFMARQLVRDGARRLSVHDAEHSSSCPG